VTTSYRIMRTDEYPDAVFYRFACECGSKDHDIVLELERDDEIPDMIIMNIYTDMEWCSYYIGDTKPDYDRPFLRIWNRLKRFWYKLKAVYRIVIKDHIEVEHSVIMRGEFQIRELIKALEEGIEKINEEQK